MAFHNTSRDNLRVIPPSCGGQTLDKLAASDRRVAVGENNARITRRCIAQLELATVDGERRVFLALHNVQTTRIRTALDGQGAIVSNHRGIRVARRSRDIFERGCAVVIDGVVARATNNAAVLHGSRGALRDGQRRLAGARVRQRFAAKIKRDVLASSNGCIFGRIRQQRDGFAALGFSDGLLQAGIALTINFRNRRLSAFPGSFSYGSGFFISCFAGRRIGRFTRRFGLRSRRIA